MKEAILNRLKAERMSREQLAGELQRLRHAAARADTDARQRRRYEERIAIMASELATRGELETAGLHLT